MNPPPFQSCYPLQNWWKILWSLHIPPKARIFCRERPGLYTNSYQSEDASCSHFWYGPLIKCIMLPQVIAFFFVIWFGPGGNNLYFNNICVITKGIHSLTVLSMDLEKNLENNEFEVFVMRC